MPFFLQFEITKVSAGHLGPCAAIFHYGFIGNGGTGSSGSCGFGAHLTFSPWGMNSAPAREIFRLSSG
jgi:hypothetical protein